MPDDRDLEERRVGGRLIAYADAAMGRLATDDRELARSARVRRASTVPVSGVLIVLVVLVAVTLLGRARAPSAGRPTGAPSSSCADGAWPATAISCDAAYRLGDQAGARVDRARIWLTSLGAVKATMRPAQQVAEPPESSEVWVIVYDGYWRCCPNAFDESGSRMPLVDEKRWLVVAEAARQGTGFVYLQDWTGKPVPDVLPPPGS